MATDDELIGLRHEVASLRQSLDQRDNLLERLRTLLDRAADPVLLHDGQGTIIEANRACWELLGLTREQYVGHNAREFDPGLAAIPKERWGRGWADMKPGSVVEVHTNFRRVDGELIPMR